MKVLFDTSVWVEHLRRDALIATVGARHGALLVTLNIDDFRMLAEELPLRVEAMTDFRMRL